MVFGVGLRRTKVVGDDAGGAAGVVDGPRGLHDEGPVLGTEHVVRTGGGDPVQQGVAFVAAVGEIDAAGFDGAFERVAFIQAVGDDRRAGQARQRAEVQVQFPLSPLRGDPWQGLQGGAVHGDQPAGERVGDRVGNGAAWSGTGPLTVFGEQLLDQGNE